MGTLVYLSLGSNLGDRELFLQAALQRLESKAGSITNISSYYETEPWGFESNTQFLNICVSLKTQLTPFQLLERINLIEKELGRNQKSDVKYASRVIDIDILTFGDQIITSEHLTIPHPHMNNRLFVLMPLGEIAPDFRHPKSKKTIQQIMDYCEDESSVIIYQSK